MNSPAQLSSQFIDGARGRILLTCWAPSGASRGSILCVPPFAEEMNKSRRMFALVAQALAADHWHVWLPDFFGTGDSAGEFRDATIEDWLGDLSATALTIGKAQSKLIGVLGLRLGALLATQFVAGKHAPIASVALWQPAASGRQLWTQFLRLRVAASMLGEVRETAADIEQRLQSAGYVEIAGYEVSSALAAGLCRLEYPAHGLSAVRCHVSEVSRREPPAMTPGVTDVAAKLRAAGASVSTEAVGGEAFWGSTEIVMNETLVADTCRFFGAASE